MARDRVLPDSPPWVFSNPGNVVAVSGSVVAYSAASKVAILDLPSGHCTQTLDSDSAKARVTWVALDGCNLAYALTDGSVRLLGLHGSDVFAQGKIVLKNDAVESMAYLATDLLVLGGKSGKVYITREATVVRTIHCASESVTKVQTKDGLCVLGSRQSLYLLSSSSEDPSLLYCHKRPVAALSLVTNKLGDLCAALIDSVGTLLTLEKGNVTHTIKLPETAATPRLFAVTWLSEQTVVCSTPDGQLHLYQLGNEVSSRLFVNNLHAKAILALITVDSQVLSVGMDRRLTLWSVSEGDSSSRLASTADKFYVQPIWSFLSLGASVQGLAATPESNVIVSFGEPHLVQWAPDFEKQMSVSLGAVSEEGLKSVALCPASTLLAIGTSQHTVIIFDLNTETVQGRIKLADVQGFEWKSPEELFILNPRAVSSWRFAANQLTSICALTEDCCAFHVTGEMYWFGSARGNLLAFMGGKRVVASTLHTGRINCIQSSESVVAAASDDCSISLHESTGQYRCSLAKHCRPVLVLAWHPSDRSLLASGSIDHTIQIWNVKTVTAIVNLRGHLGAVRHLLWTDSEMIVSGSDDQTVRRWDLKTPKADIEPPVLQVSRKPDNSKTKSLFSNLHPLVYQQNRSEAVAACKKLVFEPTQASSEHFLFSLDREKAQILISESKKVHDSIVLTFWQNLQPQTESPQYSDTVSIDSSWIDVSPLLGPAVWRSLCLVRAQEAVLDRNTHKAALCYVAGGQLKSAYQLYTSAGLFIDALILAATLGLELRDIYEQWAERLTSVGLHEQAFKCYIGSKNYSRAHESISRSQSKDTASISSLQQFVASFA